MDLGKVFSYPARFALKIFWYGLLAIIVITFIRIGYCVSVANTSLNMILPQIARYVAEYNGLPIDGSARDDTVALCRVLSDANLVSEYDSAGNPTTRQNAAFEYRIDGSRATQYNLEEIIYALESNTGKDGNNSLRAYIAGDPTDGVYYSNITHHHRLAQRGNIITVELTVWANIFSPFSINGRTVFPGISYPITRTMNVPAVKYYREFGDGDDRP